VSIRAGSQSSPLHLHTRFGSPKEEYLTKQVPCYLPLKARNSRVASRVPDYFCCNSLTHSLTESGAGTASGAALALAEAGSATVLA
jgi:hypothetical protein